MTSLHEEALSDEMPWPCCARRVEEFKQGAVGLGRGNACVLVAVWDGCCDAAGLAACGAGWARDHGDAQPHAGAAHLNCTPGAPRCDGDAGRADRDQPPLTPYRPGGSTARRSARQRRRVCRRP